MIERDGLTPTIPHERLIEPAGGFERLVARGLRLLGAAQQSKLTALKEALVSFDTDEARRLALSGSGFDLRPRAGVWSAMEAAAMSKGAFGESAVDLLLSLGANPNQRHPDEEGVERGLGLLALRSGQWGAGRLLLGKSRDPLMPDADGLGLWGAFAVGADDVPLWGKTDESHKAETLAHGKWLEAFGADPNERLVKTSSIGPKGASPLWLGAWCGVATRALLEAGADPNVADENGVTPLMRAANQRSAQSFFTLDDLLEAGADPKAVDREGRDALWWMIRGGAELGYGSNIPPKIDALVEKMLAAGVADLEFSRFDGVAKSAHPERWEQAVRAVEERRVLEICMAPVKAKARPRL
jgi:hypothetical protein